MIYLLTYLCVFVLHLCRILWAADEMTLVRGGGLVSSQLVQGAGQDGWWLVGRVSSIYWTVRSGFLAIRFQIWV